MEAATTVKRKASWTEGETAALIDAIIDCIDVIEGRFSPSLTNRTKATAWMTVLSSVNCCSLSVRTVDEIKKKWADLKSSTKKKERERRRQAKETGGGPCPTPLKDWEEKVVGVLREVVLDGVPTGKDMFATEDVSSWSKVQKVPVMPVQTAPSLIMNASPSLSPEEKWTPTMSQKETSSPGSSTMIYNKPEQVMPKANIKRKKQYTSGACDSTSTLLKLEEEKIALQKESLLLKKQKLEFLKSAEIRRAEQHETTNQLLKQLITSQDYIHPDFLSVSPVIKFSEQ